MTRVTMRRPPLAAPEPARRLSASWPACPMWTRGEKLWPPLLPSVPAPEATPGAGRHRGTEAGASGASRHRSTEAGAPGAGRYRSVKAEAVLQLVSASLVPVPTFNCGHLFAEPLRGTLHTLHSPVHRALRVHGARDRRPLRSVREPVWEP